MPRNRDYLAASGTFGCLKPISGLLRKWLRAEDCVRFDLGSERRVSGGTGDMTIEHGSVRVVTDAQMSADLTYSGGQYGPRCRSQDDSACTLQCTIGAHRS
jgi:hypothetical protein